VSIGACSKRDCVSASVMPLFARVRVSFFGGWVPGEVILIRPNFACDVETEVGILVCAADLYRNLGPGLLSLE
jgi:hypothetical protein